ncbi:unnamed protein product [Acanthoscelides obtectus]|uniref:C2H2-type domain-containing protein n=1 Tax=Acanthoscelides obtectus TaxID=200917 RepID=A0A9P0KN33_ACAOB|nr:unnamed protein product [Acanthoscelides obtectus]CAK1664826.1 Zinc finger protein 142 [Acanthoscelides obtectus]
MLCPAENFRIYNACETMANFDSTVIKELHRDTDNNKHQVTENCDQIIINNENTEYRLMNPNAESVLTSSSTANRRDPTEPLIKCEATDEVKVENDSDIDTSGITSINEEYIIKNEHDDDAGSIDSVSNILRRHLREQPGAEGGCPLVTCIHCNARFKDKTTLDNHIIKNHPEHIAPQEHCLFKATLKNRLAILMGSHPEGDCEPKNDFSKHMLEHPVEKVKLENDLDTENCGITIITEEYIIKNDDDDDGSITSVSRPRLKKTCLATSVQKETESEIHLDSKEFKVTQVTHEDIITEKQILSEMEKEKIKVENDLDSKEFGVAQFTHVFIKDEADHFIDTDTADTFNPTAMRFEGTSDGVLEIELQKGTDNSKYQVRENCDPLIIKNEIDEYGFINENMENVSTSISSEQGFTKSWIKCEAVEEFMSENDLDSDNSGIAGITEEIIIKKEDHTIIKHDDSSPTTAKDKLFVCIDCNATFKLTQMTQELMIKKETEEVFEEKVDADNDLDRREFEDTITPERAIKSEKGEVFEIQKVKIEVENDDKKVFAVDQIANVFIKDEYGHCIDTDTADTVSDRTYNIHDTKANIDHSFMSFEGSNEQVFEMQEEEIMQKSVDNKYDATGTFDQVIIKTEDDVQSTKDEPAFTNPWIKSEAGEELRLDNDLDIETEINREPIIENILKHPRSELNMCIHCNVTFTIKRSLDDHIIRLHPDLIAEVSSKIHACSHCNYRTTRRERLVQHMLKHPGLEGSYKLLQCDHCDGEFRYKTILDDHIIQKHPDYTALVSSKIYECKDCAFKTTLKRNLDTHMRKHSEADGGGQLKTCIHCNATFTSKKSLDDHIIKKHPDYIASVSTKIHKCKYCEFKTTLKRDIDRHMRKHPEADEGGCQLEMCIHCNERFTSKKSLDDHETS